VSAIVLTRAPSKRAADPAAIVDRVRHAAPRLDVTVEPSPAAALTAALTLSSRVVVAGSIFLLGDLLPELDRT
jgi:folylpolyglutamate synthase/dihydropteroate synthase